MAVSGSVSGYGRNHHRRHRRRIATATIPNRPRTAAAAQSGGRSRTAAAYICGPPELATESGYGHYWRDYERGDPPCGAAKKAKAWRKAELKAGRRLEHYDYEPARVFEYVCGPPGSATGPGTGHITKHRRDGTEPCGAAREEEGWHSWWRKTGRLDGYEYQPLAASHECGPADAATGPNAAHESWHRYHGTVPCGAALAEHARWNLERKKGRSLPDYEYKAGFVDGPTILYRFLFADGMTYWGITGGRAAVRLREHWGNDSPLGDKLRSGALHDFAVVAVFPNRAEAAAAERDRIRAEPADRVLNDHHRRAA